MRPRAIAVAILSGLALLPLAVGRGATAAEPSLVELLTQRGRLRRRLRGRLPRRRRRGGVRAAPPRVPGRPRAADAPPALGRGLRPRSRRRPALVAAARRLRGGRWGGEGPAGAPREAPGREPGRRPRAGAGDRRRGRPLQPRPQRPELQRADPRARLPPPLRAAPLLLREEGTNDDRGALVRRDRLPRARRPPRSSAAPRRTRTCSPRAGSGSTTGGTARWVAPSSSWTWPGTG